MKKNNLIQTQAIVQDIVQFDISFSYIIIDLIISSKKKKIDLIKRINIVMKFLAIYIYIYIYEAINNFLQITY